MMPDCSYHTILNPLLFRLPSVQARDLTLGVMGALAKLPGGRLLIKTLGHMEVSSQLAREWQGIRFAYPVGLVGGLDVHREVRHLSIAL